MPVVVLLLTICNAFLAAGFMWLWAERRRRDRSACALLGFLLGPLALLMLLSDLGASRSRVAGQQAAS